MTIGPTKLLQAKLDGITSEETDFWQRSDLQILLIRLIEESLTNSNAPEETVLNLDKIIVNVNEQAIPLMQLAYQKNWEIFFEYLQGIDKMPPVITYHSTEPLININEWIQQWKKHTPLEVDSFAKILAEDLTRMHYHILQAIDPKDLLKFPWDDATLQKAFPSILALANDHNYQESNNLPAMISEHILFARSMKEQKQIYNFYLKVAKECFRLQNYHAMKAIKDTLFNIDIDRFSYLVGDNPYAQKWLQKYGYLVNPMNNTPLIQKMKTFPSIPPIPLLAHELVTISETYPTYVLETKLTKGEQVNLNRYRTNSKGEYVQSKKYPKFRLEDDAFILDPKGNYVLNPHRIENLQSAINHFLQAESFPQSKKLSLFKTDLISTIANATFSASERQKRSFEILPGNKSKPHFVREDKSHKKSIVSSLIPSNWLTLEKKQAVKLIGETKKNTEETTQQESSHSMEKQKVKRK